MSFRAASKTRPGKEVDMPIYEYNCLDCRRRVSVFFRTFSEAAEQAARCPRCNGTNLHRLVSKVAVLRSSPGTEGGLDGMADESLLSGLESEDPRALAGMMRRMSDEMGEPLDPEMHEVVQRLERGESPEVIEQSMPDLGAGMDEGSAGGMGGGGLADDF
jgi:putative FmdB family regulatory protein